MSVFGIHSQLPSGQYQMGDLKRSTKMFAILRKLLSGSQDGPENNTFYFQVFQEMDLAMQDANEIKFSKKQAFSRHTEILGIAKEALGNKSWIKHTSQRGIPFQDLKNNVQLFEMQLYERGIWRNNFKELNDDEFDIAMDKLKNGEIDDE